MPITRTHNKIYLLLFPTVLSGMKPVWVKNTCSGQYEPTGEALTLKYPGTVALCLKTKSKHCPRHSPRLLHCHLPHGSQQHWCWLIVSGNRLRLKQNACKRTKICEYFIFVFKYFLERVTDERDRIKMRRYGRYTGQKFRLMEKMTVVVEEKNLTLYDPKD